LGPGCGPASTASTPTSPAVGRTDRGAHCPISREAAGTPAIFFLIPRLSGRSAAAVIHQAEVGVDMSRVPTRGPPVFGGEVLAGIISLFGGKEQRGQRARPGTATATWRGFLGPRTAAGAARKNHRLSSGERYRRIAKTARQRNAPSCRRGSFNSSLSGVSWQFWPPGLADEDTSFTDLGFADHFTRHPVNREHETENGKQHPPRAPKGPWLYTVTITPAGPGPLQNHGHHSRRKPTRHVRKPPPTPNSGSPSFFRIMRSDCPHLDRSFYEHS